MHGDTPVELQGGGVHRAMQVVIANWRPAWPKPWRRKLKPFGLCFHTSGRTIVERALKKGIKPIDLALKHYRRTGACHFVIDHDGTIYQLLDTEIRGAHVGLGGWRKHYLSGSWRLRMDVMGLSLPLSLWDRRWPGLDSPQHMFPGKTPNGAYLGVEFLPLMHEQKDGTWFSDVQYAAGRQLLLNLACMHGWEKGLLADAESGGGNSRAPAHEDLTPHSRWKKRGGWDPGALRLKPRFNWAKVLG